MRSMLFLLGVIFYAPLQASDIDQVARDALAKLAPTTTVESVREAPVEGFLELGCDDVEAGLVHGRRDRLGGDKYGLVDVEGALVDQLLVAEELAVEDGVRQVVFGACELAEGSRVRDERHHEVHACDADPVESHARREEHEHGEAEERRELHEAHVLGQHGVLSNPAAGYGRALSEARLRRCSCRSRRPRAAGARSRGRSPKGS